MLADDHATFRDGLRKLLASIPEFLVVGEAQDGVEAIAMIREQAPDVLLLDLDMPKLDGLSVLRLIRTEQRKTRVLVLTASDNPKDHLQAMRCGSCGVVRKRTTTKFLVEAIRQVHGLTSHRDSAEVAVALAELEAATVFTTTDDPRRASLTGRESEVANLIAEGHRNRDISEKLHISQYTVNKHLHSIYKKLGVPHRVALALYVRDFETPARTI